MSPQRSLCSHCDVNSVAVTRFSDSSALDFLTRSSNRWRSSPVTHNRQLADTHEHTPSYLNLWIRMSSHKCTKEQWTRTQTHLFVSRLQHSLNDTKELLYDVLLKGTHCSHCFKALFLVTGEPTEQKATPDASHTSLWCVVSDYK